jgi:hypothetical protein
MLKDAGVDKLKRDLRAEKIGDETLAALVTVILSSPDGELRDMARWYHRRFRRRKIIADELGRTRIMLLETLLNSDRRQPPSPIDVREICESAEARLWMRFDRPRVNRLFEGARRLFQDGNFRAALMRQTYLDVGSGEHHLGLLRVQETIGHLVRATEFLIDTDGRAAGLVELPKADAYAGLADEMVREFARGTSGGSS